MAQHRLLKKKAGKSTYIDRIKIKQHLGKNMPYIDPIGKGKIHQNFPIHFSIKFDQIPKLGVMQNDPLEVKPTMKKS